MIARAHEHGIKVYGATLTPFAGTKGNYYTPEREEKREAVNPQERSFDAVIDFDKATQDPAHPKQFLPAYDSGDHLHPNDAGYKAMGDALDSSVISMRSQRMASVRGADLFQQGYPRLVTMAFMRR